MKPAKDPQVGIFIDPIDSGCVFRKYFNYRSAPLQKQFYPWSFPPSAQFDGSHFNGIHCVYSRGGRLPPGSLIVKVAGKTFHRDILRLPSYAETYSDSPQQCFFLSSKSRSYLPGADRSIREKGIFLSGPPSSKILVSADIQTRVFPREMVKYWASPVS
jgi:hypothetical protein